MIKRSWLFIFLFFLCVFPSAAQNLCAPRQEMVDRLRDQFKEYQIAVGLINVNRLVEVFVSKEGGWTIVISDISGKSCVASAGKNWSTVDVPKKLNWSDI